MWSISTLLVDGMLVRTYDSLGGGETSFEDTSETESGGSG